MNVILPHEMGRFRFGIAGTVDPGNQQIEGLVALADLAAGALSEVLTLCWNSVGTSASKVLLRSGRLLSNKAKLVASWLAENDHPLRKLVILVEGAESTYKTKVLNIFPEDGRPWQSPFDWRKDVDEYLKGRILALMGYD